MSLGTLLDLLFFAAGLALGMVWPRPRPRSPFRIEAQPLPCVLFPRGMEADQRIVWLRWMADKLKDKQAEGGDL